jgi:HEAT repeat protein
MNNQQKHENIKLMIQQLQTNQDKAVIKEAAKRLGEIGTDNLDAINALINLVKTTSDEPTRWIGIQSLGEMGANNNVVIQTLIEQLSIARIPTRRIASQTLAKIAVGKLEAINPLVNLVQTTEEEYTRQYVAYTLARIAEGNKKAVNALIDLIYKSSNEYTLKNCVDGLVRSGNWNEEITINAIMQVVRVAEDYNTYYYTRRAVYQYLKKIGIAVVNYSPVSICQLLEHKKQMIYKNES